MCRGSLATRADSLRDWIATIPSWPSHFRYRPMREVGLELSELLRDPKGPYRVDIIIALTHSRVPNVSWGEPVFKLTSRTFSSRMSSGP